MPVEYFSTDEIRCPYCYYEYQDSWDFFGEEGIEQCCKCNKTFKWNRDHKVTYDSYPDCELNGEQHDFKTKISINDGGIYDTCSQCPKIIRRR